MSVEVIILIKIDRLDLPRTGLPLNTNGMVMLRLTRMARSPELRAHLAAYPALAHWQQRVEDTGCAVEPAWGSGAQLLHPME